MSGRPSEAEAAWTSRLKLEQEVQIVDESHFRVAVLKCRHCSQQFLSVFTETIDWEAGEDPMYWTLLPILESEAKDLSEGGPVSENRLNSIGPERRSLRHDFPKNEPKTTYWDKGVRVGLHD
jgi:hypothetical protein